MLSRLILAVSAAVVLFAPAQADTPAPPQPQSITAGVWLIPGSFLPDRQPDGNTIVFDAPGGLVVMDTGRHKWHRQAILDFARAQNKPIAAIINSHWHLDHVSGNPDLRAAYPGLKVYASDAINEALTGFLAKSADDARPYLDDKTLPPDTREDLRNDLATTANGKALLPDVVIDRSSTRDLAGRKLAVNLAPNAATAGDVWLYDAKTKIVASGDLVTLPAPFLDTACPAGWSKALARIDSTPFKTLIPGHGIPMTHAGFMAYHRAFDALVACSATSHNARECAAGWAHSVKDLLGGSPPAIGMTAYYVTSVLRAPGGKSATCKA
jgi:glyoxylase-like metal-dependent hydrolase (beta-lactamase superfamily II)